jgi:hypothetical protein
MKVARGLRREISVKKELGEERTLQWSSEMAELS